MSNDKEWRQFEKLVARIERILAPKGATVKSPDRVEDILTGSLREVDASIRMNVGSTSVLITIECRKRSAVQDDTWIEQLATKKEKIGAAKTIAVSASGFSEPAQITARLKGIELRILEEVIDEDIVNWPKSIELNHIILHLNFKNVSAVTDSNEVFNFDILKTKSGIRFIPDLVRTEDNGLILVNEVFNLGIDAEPNFFTDINLNGIKVSKVLNVIFPTGAMKVQYDKANQFMKSISFEIESWIEKKKEIINDGINFKYMGVDSLITRGVEFRSEINGIPIILNVSTSNQSK